MSAKITNTNRIALQNPYRILTATITDTKRLDIAITFPGTQRDDAETLEMTNLNIEDVVALRDFLNKFIEK